VKSAILLVPMVLLSTSVAVRAQADDPITASLSKAKEAYAAAEELFRKAVLDRLKAAEERATKAGKKAAVDQIVAEREAFESTGALPTSFKTNDLQVQRTQARQRLLAAYDKAISGFTKQRKRSEADAVEQEMLGFKAQFSGDQLKPGSVWRGEKRYLKGGPAGLHPFELRVTERSGDAFRGIINEDEMSHDVEGKIDNEKVSWKIARVRRGAYPGQPQDGVFEGGVMKLHFARRDGRGAILVEAVGTIKLQKTK
jgi:hypothetical protein